jgi:acyl-CoA synthetase (AMP-forming)/AMP-acid ligase II
MNELLLHDIVRSSAGRTPHRVAISYNGAQRTFGELLERIEHLAAVLAGRGIGHGARVIWWADTNLDAGTLYYALAHLGAVFVPLNPRFSDDEFRAVADIADPALVIADDGHAGDVTLDELMASRAPSVVEFPEVHEQDPDVIFFTSGTTGQPKGCVLSHRSNRVRTQTSARTVGPIMTMFPQFHWGGWSFCHTSWYLGYEHVLVDGGDTEGILSSMDRRRAGSFYGIPAVWRRILDADRTGYDHSALREANTGTSSTPPELLRAINDAFPETTTTIGYGATEAGGLCQLAAADTFRKPGSVGLPMNGVLTRIEDEELWVKSPQAFLGYFRNPEATDAVVVDGWYRTGDLVSRDDEGYLWVVGRAKDMIRTGGESVAPAEVDVVVQRHPAVADGAVAGVPDTDWGEIVTAFVVLRPGQSVTLPELRAHCGATLSAFKQPRRLVVVGSIPRTGPTGQVQRRKLVELALADASDPTPT